MRLSGAEARATPAFVVAAAGLLVVFAAADGFGPPAIAEAGAVVAIYALSVLMHETAHARSARRFGMAIEGITLSLAGGVTRYSGPDPGPQALRAIALAGPKRSALLALVAFAAAVAAWAAGWRGVVGSLCVWTAQVNAALALLNLLPFGTTDGAMARAAGRRMRAPRGSPSP